MAAGRETIATGERPVPLYLYEGNVKAFMAHFNRAVTSRVAGGTAKASGSASSAARSTSSGRAASASGASKSGKIKPVTTLETGFKTAITQALNDLGTKRGKDAKNFIDSFRHFGPSNRIICRVISKNQANLRKISVRQPGVREYVIELLT